MLSAEISTRPIPSNPLLSDSPAESRLMGKRTLTFFLPFSYRPLSNLVETNSLGEPYAKALTV